MPENPFRLPDTIRHPKKRALLKALAKSGAVRRACAAACVHHSTYYEWRLDDAAFADAADVAREHYIEWLEAVADKRATSGPRPSDTLLIFRLKALRPHVYRERYEHKVAPEEIDREIERLMRELKACPNCSCPTCREKRSENNGLNGRPSPQAELAVNASNRAVGREKL